jgi:hypothetical protein
LKNFPTRAPVGILLGGVLGLLSVIPVFAIWHRYQPWIERFYFPQYIGSALAQTPMGTVISFFHSGRNTRTYFVLMQGGKPVTSSATLDPAARASVRFVNTTPRIFGLWLQNQIYGGREFREVMQTPLAIWIATVLSLMLAGVSYDYVRRKRAREGVALRGPDLLSRREFNRVTKGDGFTLHVRN